MELRTVMTSAQVRTIFEAALDAGVIFPGWSYLLAAPVVIVGAYFAGYRNSKRDAAEARKNFEFIRAELARIRAVTDRIEVLSEPAESRTPDPLLLTDSRQTASEAASADDDGDEKEPSSRRSGHVSGPH